MDPKKELLRGLWVKQALAEALAEMRRVMRKKARLRSVGKVELRVGFGFRV